MKQIEFQPATIEDRRRYYTEEWSEDDVPEFIQDSISQREFGFDHDGNGPKDRYNRFRSPEELGEFLRKKAPFAAYSSVSMYVEPLRRAGWEKAELIFDIDAKDLPVKNCCGDGQVCSFCLGRAKGLILKLDEILKDDLDVHHIHYVYSGRGYHVRIFDEDIMPEGDKVRAAVLDYVRGSKVLHDESKRKSGRDPTLLIGGYSSIFRSMIMDIINVANDINDLRAFGISSKKADEILDNRAKIVEEAEAGSFKTLETINKSSHDKFINRVSSSIANNLDAKVSVDVKRILRLPSSLHSKVSMKCMEVKDIKKFEPLRDAVPEFVEERE